MSQTYRIGTLNFTGSQAILSASLDVYSLNTGSIFTINREGGAIFSVSSSGDLFIGSGSSTRYIRGFLLELNSTNGPVRLIASSNNSVHFGTNNIVRWSVDGLTSNLVAAADNLYDIGALTTTRPRNIYAAGTGSVFAALDVTSGSVNALRTFPSTGNVFVGSTPVDGGFKLDVNGTARLQGALSVSTGGATIIGNTTITGSLEVSGSGRFTDTLRLANDKYLQLTYTGGSLLNGFGIKQDTSNRLIIDNRNFAYTAISIKDISAVLSSTGLVGIFTTNPTTTLDVSGSFNVTNTIRTFTSTGNTFLGSTPVDGGFKLDVNGITRLQGALTVSTGGATIIGNTTVTGSLDVSGSGRFTGGLTVTGSVANRATEVTADSVGFTRISDGLYVSGIWGSNNGQDLTHAARLSHIFTTGAGLKNGTAMFIIHGGTQNVNIGENLTDPNFKLNISGSGTNGVFNANNILRVSGNVVSVTGSFNISGSGRFTDGLTVTGSATVTDVLTLPYQDPLPSSPATGSIALSGSGATFVGMFVWTGVWTQI